MFEKELEYFIKEQPTLLKQHEGKTLALKNEAVIGVYDSTLDAYLAIKRNGQLGSVMLQECTRGPKAFTTSVSTLGMIKS